MRSAIKSRFQQNKQSHKEELNFV